LNHIASSYEFHLRLEAPGAFLRREWKAITVFGGGFSLVMLAAVLAVDPAFFYPRLQTDTLLYYLKAKSLVETGSTAARAAVNSPPFAYAAMPGVLRAPFILAFRDFDHQLRGMQLLNIPIVASVALMSAYIFSWTQPSRRHWMTIAFAFIFTLLSPVWVANVFSPLADAPYAAFSLAAVIVAARILAAPPHRRQWLLILLFAIFFVMAFLLRFTAPVLLVFVAALARGRWAAGLSPRQKLAVFGVPAALIVLLVALNANAIFGRYFLEPFGFLVRGDKPGMMLNLLAVAIPSQIIPSFHLGFVHPPIMRIYETNFASTPPDTAWMIVGLFSSFVVITGVVKSRDRFLPEILYLLAPLPVLILIMPSTTRYLMSYQPIIWIFFYFGARHVASSYAPGAFRLLHSRAFLASVGVIVLALAGGLRWWKTAGTQSERVLAVNLTEAPAYISEVSSTFRGMREFLESLPKDSTLLVGAKGTVGRWTVIADRSYYVPDRALAEVARTRNVYLLAECGTLEVCQSWGWWKDGLRERVTRFGDFEFNVVYSIDSPRARAEVSRIRSVP